MHFERMQMELRETCQCKCKCAINDLVWWLASKRANEWATQTKPISPINEHKQTICVCVCCVLCSVTGGSICQIRPSNKLRKLLATTKNPISNHVQIQQVQSQTNTPKGQNRAQNQNENTLGESNQSQYQFRILFVRSYHLFVCL